MHHVFYRDLVSVLLELDPSTGVLAIDETVRAFTLPGKGIENFAEHSRVIAKAGIYDLAMHHDLILVPVVVERWDLPHLEGLSPEADRARERCLAHIERVGRAGHRIAAGTREVAAVR